MSLITPDTGLLFWMVVIFGVVFFILARFGFPVITRAVQKRTDHIRESLAAAEQARLSLEATAAEQRKLLEQTRAEQGRMLQEASRTRDEIIAQAKAEAEAQTVTILQKAREEIAAEKESAMSEIRGELSSLSVAVAEKILRRELHSEADQVALLERFADEAANTPLS